ncbi:MAG TPA: Hsp20/alpha crystallin family protein [Acidimicrobiales bacterium]|nr:Hsp20/alpha crystallin family protein [Acidimicrobiales bacterium]
MLMRFDPFREFDRIGQQFWGQARMPVLPLDAYRSGDEFVVHVDVPGVDPDSIELTVERNLLVVKAERAWQPSEGAEVVTAERPQGSFTRQLFLGENLDVDNIAASYENGVLTLRIPVAQAAKPRRVEIQSGRPQAIEASASAA